MADKYIRTKTIDWEKLYGPDSLWGAGFYAINRTTDDNFVLCSQFVWNDYNDNNVGIYKIDHNGDSIWSHYFTYHNDSAVGAVLYSVNSISTSGYLAAGTVTPNNANPYPWVVTVDSNGYAPRYVPDTTTGIGIVSGDSLGFKIFPNPSSGYFWVSYLLSNNTSTEITVCNTLGQTVCRQTLPTNRGLQKIEVSNWAAGIYIWRVTNASGDKLAEGKVIKE